MVMLNTNDRSREFGLFDRGRDVVRRGLAAIMIGLLAGTPVAGKAQQPTQRPDASGTFTMKVQTDIVLTNVVVRDKKTGEVVKGLKQSDLRFWRMGSHRRLPLLTTRTWMKPPCCGKMQPSAGKLASRIC